MAFSRQEALGMARRGAIALALSALLAFGLVFFLMPIKYSARATLYVANSDEWSKFIGIARSRLFASMVEDRLNLTVRLKLKHREDAVDTIVKGITINDVGKDGIVPFSFTLGGPPQLAPGGAERRKVVRNLVAEVTNAYVAVFRDYVGKNAIDSDTLRLRQIHLAQDRERRRYEDAARALTEYVRSHQIPRGYSPDLYFTTEYAAAKGIAKNTERDTPSVQDIYAVRQGLESELRAAEAQESTRRTRIESMLGNVNAIPSEDPLLLQAREAASSARSNLERLRQQLGAEHPQVVLAADKARLAEEQLARQVGAVRARHTTDDAQAAARLESLRRRLETVRQQVVAAERFSRAEYQVIIGLEKARSEVALRLDILKALAVQAASEDGARLPAADRMQLLESARLPESGAPGPKMLLAFTAVLTLFLTVMALGVDAARLWASRLPLAEVVVLNPEESAEGRKAA